MNVAEALNAMSDSASEAALLHCCASQRWVDSLLGRKPYTDDAAVFDAADEAAKSLTREDWLAAFLAHPRIGNINSLRERYASTKHWASAEQAGVSQADEQTLQTLAAVNELYFVKFGYIFIICATGKSASEMLHALQIRLPNSVDEELPIAAAEQQKITHLRLQKLAQET